MLQPSAPSSQADVSPQKAMPMSPTSGGQAEFYPRKATPTSQSAAQTKQSPRRAASPYLPPTRQIGIISPVRTERSRKQLQAADAVLDEGESVPGSLAPPHVQRVSSDQGVQG